MTTEKDELDKRTYEALAAFRFVLRHFLHFSEERSRTVGLTPQQYQLLLAVAGQPGRDWATITELADAFRVRHSGAVGLVDRCEAQGLVRRVPGQEDRREVQVWLTDEGRKCLTEVAAGNMAELERLLRTLRTLFETTAPNLRDAEQAIAGEVEGRGKEGG